MTTTPLYVFLSALGYPINLTVIILLWFAARRAGDYRRFVTVLALAWTLGLGGNIAWVIHDLVFQTPLPALSWVDAFYLSRYVALFLAFWRFAPALPPATRGRRLAITFLVTLLTAVLITLELYQGRATVPAELAWPLILGYAIYPVLDIAVLYAAWHMDAAETGWRMASSLLLLGAACYTAANWINLAIHLFLADAVPSLPTFFWLASDLLAGMVAIGILRKRESNL